MKYNVSVKFAHGVGYEFYCLESKKMEELKAWIENQDAGLLIFENGKTTYYLNRDYMCAATVDVDNF